MHSCIFSTKAAPEVCRELSNGLEVDVEMQCVHEDKWNKAGWLK